MTAQSSTDSSLLTPVTPKVTLSMPPRGEDRSPKQVQLQQSWRGIVFSYLLVPTLFLPQYGDEVDAAVSFRISLFASGRSDHRFQYGNGNVLRAFLLLKSGYTKHIMLVMISYDS
jgi:hypothetical protein